MTDLELQNIVNKAAMSVVGKTIEDFNSNDSIFKLLEIESIDFVDLVFEIEKALKCEIDINKLVENSFNPSTGRFGSITPKLLMEFIFESLAKST